VALGRLGGLVRSAAKQRANRENRRKGGLVKSRKKTRAVRRNARRPKARSSQEVLNNVIAMIRARFGDVPIGLGEGGIRYRAVTVR
jgi:hypothetical protein